MMTCGRRMQFFFRWIRQLGIWIGFVGINTRRAHSFLICAYYFGKALKSKLLFVRLYVYVHYLKIYAIFSRKIRKMPWRSLAMVLLDFACGFVPNRCFILEQKSNKMEFMKSQFWRLVKWIYTLSYVYVVIELMSL